MATSARRATRATPVTAPGASPAQTRRRPAPRPDTAELDARFFRGLGDPTRLRILRLLLEGERSVGELVEALGGLQGRISSHLMCLRWCGYVTTRREGRRVYYSITDPRVRDILHLAQSMRREHAESLAACAVIAEAE